MSSAQLRASRLVVAIVSAAALILLAPFLGEVRRMLRASFPGHFVLILGAALGLMLAAAVATALVHIRDRRAMRYGSIATALVVATAYSVWNASPDPQVNAVERFHFLQYGLITFLFYRGWHAVEDPAIFVLPVLAGLVVGTVEEWFQWFIPARVGEMRDVFLNGAAIGCGVLFSFGVDPPRHMPGRLQPGSLRRIAQLAAVAIIVFAAFVHSVHLGYVVTDPDAGTFHSRYDASRLLALSRNREVAWKTAPPLQRPPRVSREDQYMSEGLLHVQERNRRWAADDIDAAWQENLILERFYAPVLDTPSYVSATGHRWPEAQRADAERRRAPAPAAGTRAAPGYLSNADEGFIRTWPRHLYWASVIGFASLMLLIGRADRRNRHRDLAPPQPAARPE
jgi:hypothetical protein